MLSFLCQVQLCHVYKIQSNTEGHYNPGLWVSCIFTLNIHIIQQKCFLGHKVQNNNAVSGSLHRIRVGKKKLEMLNS